MVYILQIQGWFVTIKCTGLGQNVYHVQTLAANHCVHVCTCISVFKSISFTKYLIIAFLENLIFGLKSVALGFQGG